MPALAMTIAFGLLYALTLPGLIKRGNIRDLVAFCMLLTACFAICLAYALEFRFPYITTEITRIYFLLTGQ